MNYLLAFARVLSTPLGRLVGLTATTLGLSCIGSEEGEREICLEGSVDGYREACINALLDICNGTMDRLRIHETAGCGIAAHPEYQQDRTYCASSIHRTDAPDAKLQSAVANEACSIGVGWVLNAASVPYKWRNSLEPNEGGHIFCGAEIMTQQGEIVSVEPDGINVDNPACEIQEQYQ